MKTGENQGWLKYLAGDFEKKELSPAQMLKMLKTHEVVGTEPHLVFKRRQQQESQVCDEEMFQFKDECPIKSEDVTANPRDQEPVMQWVNLTNLLIYMYRANVLI
jgi:hypothetical protein